MPLSGKFEIKDALEILHVSYMELKKNQTYDKIYHVLSLMTITLLKISMVLMTALHKKDSPGVLQNIPPTSNLKFAPSLP